MSVVRRILELGSPISTLFLSTTGCFVFMQRKGFVAARQEADTAAFTRVAGMCHKPLADIRAGSTGGIGHS